MARDDPQINIRMPAKLKASLEDAAAENNRSVTAEIVARLEQSMVGPKHPPNIVVRLEALPYGYEPEEISLGTFFENFGRTIRDSVQAIKQARKAAEKVGRAADSLGPALDSDSADSELAEEAAAEARTRLRERRMREVERMERERQRREAEEHGDKSNE